MADRWMRLILIVGAVALLCSCQPQPTSAGGVARYNLTTAGDVAGLYLVRKTTRPAAVEVSARGTDPSSNGRTLWTRKGLAVTRDQEACVTWTSIQGPNSQPGVALRIRTTKSRVQAITVTNNILHNIRWVMNVHVWDSDNKETNGDSHPTLIKGFDVSEGLDDGTGKLRPLPWRLCARAVGSTVELKAWATSVAEPAWGDSRYGGSTAIPPAWTQPGMPGWFAGHLGTDGRLDLADLTAGPVAAIS